MIKFKLINCILASNNSYIVYSITYIYKYKIPTYAGLIVHHVPICKNKSVQGFVSQIQEVEDYFENKQLCLCCVADTFPFDVLYIILHTSRNLMYNNIINIIVCKKRHY